MLTVFLCWLWSDTGCGLTLAVVLHWLRFYTGCCLILAVVLYCIAVMFSELGRISLTEIYVDLYCLTIMLCKCIMFSVILTVPSIVVFFDALFIGFYLHFFL